MHNLCIVLFKLSCVIALVEVIFAELGSEARTGIDGDLEIVKDIEMS